MKRKLTKDDLVAYIKRFDKRSGTLTPEQIDDIILSAFGELSTVKFPFSSEMILNLTPYIDAGEDKLTVDIEEDVIDVFDLYVTIENDKDIYEKVHGTNVFRDEEPYKPSNMQDTLYRDGFELSRVHVQLDKLPLGSKNLVIKFHYHPDEKFVNMFVDAKSLRAIQFAVGTSFYDYFHDVERSMQKRTGMERVAKGIENEYPESYQILKPSMFPSGV